MCSNYAITPSTALLLYLCTSYEAVNLIVLCLTQRVSNFGIVQWHSTLLDQQIFVDKPVIHLYFYESPGCLTFVFGRRLRLLAIRNWISCFKLGYLFYCKHA